MAAPPCQVQTAECSALGAGTVARCFSVPCERTPISNAGAWLCLQRHTQPRSLQRDFPVADATQLGKAAWHASETRTRGLPEPLREQNRPSPHSHRIHVFPRRLVVVCRIGAPIGRSPRKDVCRVSARVPFSDPKKICGTKHCCVRPIALLPLSSRPATHSSSLPRLIVPPGSIRMVAR